MKSAMSTKVYWKARKLLQSIVFRCKSLLYTYMDTLAKMNDEKEAFRRSYNPVRFKIIASTGIVS